MGLNRRELLTTSALVLARPRLAFADAAAPAGPIVLCWNENPYGPSPAARAALSNSIGVSCRYPDDDIDALTEALAKKACGGLEAHPRSLRLQPAPTLPRNWRRLV
jgi:histidinol-phosphate aminotransferase